MSMEMRRIELKVIPCFNHSDSLPSTIGNLSDLISLDLRYNSFGGMF